MNDIKTRLEPLTSRYNHLTQDLPADIESLQRNLDTSNLFTIPVLEALLDAAKEEAKRIVSTDIICLMAEYGISDATLEDGTTIKKTVYMETKQTDKMKVAAWLEANGYGSIIKDTIAFPKGVYDERLERYLAENGYDYSRDSNINGQSLKKVVRDHVDAGGNLPPEDAIEVRMYEEAVVKPPKAAKGF